MDEKSFALLNDTFRSLSKKTGSTDQIEYQTSTEEIRNVNISSYLNSSLLIQRYNKFSYINYGWTVKTTKRKAKNV